MNVEEFKEKYPDLAHLEGDALWDAMTLAVWKEQPPFVRQEGDEEIAYTKDIGDGYTLSVTKGADRAWKEFIGEPKPLEFSNMQIWMPQPDGGVVKYDENGKVE